MKETIEISIKEKRELYNIVDADLYNNHDMLSDEQVKIRKKLLKLLKQ